MKNIKKLIFKLKMKWNIFKLKFKKEEIKDYDKHAYIYEEDE